MKELDELRARLPEAARDIYYRSRHQLGGVTAEKSPRLRMQRMAGAANRGDFELCCLAVSALAGCATCLLAHEASCMRHGLSDEHVYEALRIASVVNAAAVALACEPKLEAHSPP